MTDTSLRDRVVLVTGAAGDIGRAMARRFLAAGARVALVDRDAAGLADCLAGLADCLAGTAGAWPAGDARAITLLADIADEHAAQSAVATAVRRFGTLHVLVNNAARVTPQFPVGAIPVDEWRATLEVNLTGAWLMARAALPHLAAAGGGVVINIASQLGHVATPGRGAYSVSKAGLIALTRAIAIDHAAERIRAVSLSPGAVMTSRLTSRYGGEEAVNRELAPRHPIGRIGTPAEIAQVACFLAGDAAAFITGVDVLADGGYTAV